MEAPSFIRQRVVIPNVTSLMFHDIYSGHSTKPVPVGATALSSLPWSVISAKSSGRSRVDLLSMTDKEAAGMLHTHLTKPSFEGEGASDNLMSWSSSLLFVIQYALWRCHHSGCAQDEVKICAVDTRKFPRGQFARDMSLLRVYRQTSALDEQQRSFFDFRLRDADYDNGEYLSQGEVHHAGRSCVSSLGQLVSAGLHDLYPEFAEPEAKRSWTRRSGPGQSGCCIFVLCGRLSIIPSVST
ncbi:hypothetical protein GE09DRAFT_587861 [Coniochaeta sp. 2T2.1]|nr:hypothetical protein GE09DRAFT_587861 [Coniochaeta sp. 2T2.1]